MNLKYVSVSILTIIGRIGGILLYTILIIGCAVIYIPYLGKINLSNITITKDLIINLIVLLIVLFFTIIITKQILKIRKKFLPIRDKKYANDNNRHANQTTAYGIFYVLLTSFLTLSIPILNIFPNLFPPLVIAISIATTVTISNIISRTLGLGIITSRHKPIALCFEKADYPSYEIILKNITLSFLFALLFFSLFYLLK